MKHYFLIAVFLYAFAAKAQNPARLNSIKEFTTFNLATDLVTITDNDRGGTFSLYTGDNPVDNGMVFGDRLGRKWQRIVEGNVIYIKWYGALPATNSTTDLQPLFVAAQDYINRNSSRFRILQLSECPYNTWYYLKQTFVLKNIELRGTALAKHPTSLLQIAPNITGIRIPAYYTTADGQQVTNFANVTNIQMRSYAPTGPADKKSHSFEINAIVNFNNVEVISNYNGDGFHLSACAAFSKTTAGFGNADGGSFVDCQATECYNGFWIEGCDANTILFTNCSAVSNERWGIFDRGLLGNTWIQPHMSNNGRYENRAGKTEVAVMYKEKVWRALNDDAADNINKQPDLFPQYWEQTQTDMPNIRNWDKNRSYMSGGAYCMTNANARNLLINPYTESYQLNGRMGPRSVTINGQNNGQEGGVFLKALNNQAYFTNDIIAFPGKPDGVISMLSTASDGGLLIKNNTKNTQMDIRPDRVNSLFFSSKIPQYKDGTVYLGGMNDKLGFSAGYNYGSISMNNLRPQTGNNSGNLSYAGVRYHPGELILNAEKNDIYQGRTVWGWRPLKEGTMGTDLSSKDFADLNMAIDKPFITQDAEWTPYFPVIGEIDRNALVSYEIGIRAVSAGGVWIENHVLYYRMINGVPTLKKDELVGSPLKEGGMAAAEWRMRFDAALGRHVLEFKGLSKTSVSWSVSYKKTVVNQP